MAIRIDLYDDGQPIDGKSRVKMSAPLGLPVSAWVKAQEILEVAFDMCDPEMNIPAKPVQRLTLVPQVSQQSSQTGTPG